MNSTERQLCTDALGVLMGQQHVTKNYLFLDPVPLDMVPGYLNVVKRPMDLGTVKRQLEAGVYKSVESFWGDVDLVFSNAIAYHKSKPATQHIVKYAKEMMKLVSKEKKAVEKKRGGGTTKKSIGLKLKLSTSKSKDPPASAAPEKKQPKLKLKLSLGKNKGKTLPPGVAKAITPASAPAPPKLQIKAPVGPRGKELPKGAITPGSSTTAPKPASAAKKKSASSTKPKSKSTGSKKSTTTKTGNKSTTAKSTASKSSSAKSTSTKSASTKSATTKSTTPKPSAKSTPKPATAKSTTTKPATAKSAAKPTTAKSTATKQTNAKLTSAKSTSKSTSSKQTSKSSVKPKPKTSTQKITFKKPRASTPSSATSGAIGATGMTDRRKASCYKVLQGLRRRRAKDVVWFNKPATADKYLSDYAAKIPKPMDLGTITGKLDNDKYTDLSEFVLDLRRVWGNCLRYNTSMNDSFRPMAREIALLAEQLMAWYLVKAEGTQMYPPLLYCWGFCLHLLDRLLNVTNPGDKLQTAHYFLHPASFYFGGKLPEDYLATNPTPMDFGSITSNLLEGAYQSIEPFCRDCRLVLDNCMKYYKDKPDGAVYVEQASRLHALLNQQLVALEKYDKSPKADAMRQEAINVTNVNFPKPPPELLMQVITDLRAVQYTDRLTKLTEPAVRIFEKPVDLSVHRDYRTYVRTPMWLEQVERKVKAGQYHTPEEFEYDVNLIFKNCETYNAARKTTHDHMVTLGKHAAKNFKKLFYARMKVWENPEAAAQAAAPAPTERKRPASATPSESQKKSSSPTQQQPTKKVKVEAPAGKIAPRINIKSNAPVPLHVAIAKIKEGFPMRRPYKLLQSWEGACARFFRELMRHPWISAARPKFIFHVPVPDLYPSLKDAYKAKIKRPMDLTTAEAKLLDGQYQNAQDFVDDVALVFANAITFNRAGRDEGDQLSISYYDASIHLLRYTRWLSLEWLVQYLTDEPSTDHPAESDMPPMSWKLTKPNKAKGREEMERIVLNEHIDKSFEGDRYTWQEADCEKLLKALRHQSDNKHMHFFVQPSFPPDYTAFISRPIAWDNCNKALQKRQYDKFGDIIDDLRLIFSNALKYNLPHKGRDTVSGKAYDAAVFMSVKLEQAIDKMMVSVAEHLGRDQVDDARMQREHDAEERAEEERIRAAMKEQEGRQGESGQQKNKDTVENVRIMNRRNRRDMDFEMPTFDEDDGNHEQSHLEMMRQQKAIFEQQRQQRNALRTVGNNVGALVFARLAQCDQAQRWIIRMKKVNSPKAAKKDKAANKGAQVSRLGSSVLAEIKRRGRKQISLKPALKKKKNPKPSRNLLSLE